MKKVVKRLLIFLIAFALIYAIWRTWIRDYVMLEQLKEHRMYLKNVVNSHYLLSMLLYITVYIVVAACALPAAALLTIMGGFLFGGFIGALYTTIGATIGACIAFIICRYVFGDQIRRRYVTQLEYMEQTVKKYGAHFLLFVRLLPIFPFFLVNIIASLLPITFAVFAITTAIGIIPATLVYSFAGEQLYTIQAIGDVLSIRAIIVLSFLALVSLLPLLINALKRRNIL